jgi:putative nucleotidyltransferase with HDIG domain
VLTSTTFDARTGATVFFKCENFQRMGAFKFRGAYNALAQFTPQQRQAGVIAFSSGNHAQAIALSGQLLGIPTVIVMPHDAPAAKLAATRAYQDGQPGSEVVIYDRYTEDRAAIGARIAAERKEAEIKLAESERKLKKSLFNFVGSVASIVGLRDPYTAGHQLRVSELAVVMAKEIGLSEFQIEGIHLGSMIHDIGKIQIPAEILSKPGRLSDLEYQIVKQHVIAGYEIMKNGEFPWPIAQMILQHHERLDGSGYPHGLKGEEIILEARILSVADVVEAISSHRPYRPSLGIDAAFAEITSGRGVRYCPRSVDACIALFKERGFKFST